jgi:hypothetical protein
VTRARATTSHGRTTCRITTATSARRATTTRRTTTSTRRARATCSRGAADEDSSAATRRTDHCRPSWPASTATSRSSASTPGSARPSSTRSCDTECRPRMPSTPNGSCAIYGVSTATPYNCLSQLDGTTDIGAGTLQVNRKRTSRLTCRCLCATCASPGPTTRRPSPTAFLARV